MIILCEKCFPEWKDCEIYTHIPISSCVCCGSNGKRHAFSRKTMLKYKDTLVSKNSTMYELLTNKDKDAKEKVEKHYAQLSRDFNKYWTKEYDHLRNFKIGDQ